MFWTILFLILISLIKVLPTVLPLGAVEWIMSKFATHAKLDDQKVSVTIDNHSLDHEEKMVFINYFNEAIFMEKYYIYPGTEQSFLPPQKNGKSIIIDAKLGNKDVRLHLYNDKNSIDVVKQFNKKVIAYNIHSAKLQEYFISKGEKVI
ncbi:YfmQ family protein [Robertmurraya korlensis]|uniref:YfmQ family protein n=1 Tax=Robertmurraya korlensis TaxID=519977 RepID=UPI00203DEF5D|nr:YfmQ family protein [Robertmurraya korlensis]MCM3601652.1 YfmQ family protein [Robertmurraya korlensis]